MSGTAIIQGRYATCEITTATSRKSKAITASSRKSSRAIKIKPSSVTTKHLSQLLYSIDSADEAYQIITTCLEETSSSLDGRPEFDVDNNETSTRTAIRSLFDRDVNHIEKLRQKKINRKCTGWKYPDTKNCITAMANLVEVAAYTHIQQQKQTRRQLFKEATQINSKPASLETTSVFAPCTTSRSTTPCRSVQTETLLLTAPTNSFDDENDLSSSSYCVRPSAVSINMDSVSVLVPPTTCNKITSTLLQNIVESDTDDSIRHSKPSMLPPRDVVETPPTPTITPNTRFMNFSSVLEHATSTNIVSDDSEMDVATTTTTSKYESRTTTSTAIASKKSKSMQSSLDSCQQGSMIPIHVQVPTRPIRTDDEIKLQNFWSQFLEHIQFRVAKSGAKKYHRQQSIRLSCGSTNVTTAMPIYDIYRLMEPIYFQGAMSIHDIRIKLYREFTSLYYGMTNSTNRRSMQKRLVNSDNSIRINVDAVNGNEIWIQLNICESYSFEWGGTSSKNPVINARNVISGMKKNKNHMDFLIIIPSCNDEPQTYVAISSSRMKSKVKLTSYILSAIENAFVPSTVTLDENLNVTIPEEDTADDFLSCKKFTATHDKATKPHYDKCLSGVDPYELFRSLQVQVAHRKGVMQEHNDAMTCLHSAATGCLYSGKDHDQGTIRSRKRRLWNGDDDITTKY